MQSLRRLLKSILLLFCILRTTAQRTPLSIERQMFVANGDYGRDQLWALFRQLAQSDQHQQHQQERYDHRRGYEDEARTGNGNAEIVLESSPSSSSSSALARNEFDKANVLLFPLRMDDGGRDASRREFAVDDAAAGGADEMYNIADINRLRLMSTEFERKDKRRTYAYQRIGKSTKQPPWPRSWQLASPSKRGNGQDPVSDKLVMPLSIDALKRLGFYFNDLKNNVHYAHNYKWTQDQLRLLDGDHPLHMLQVNSPEMDPQDVSAFLQALRTYQPSHKVRSLVSMTPQGYHGSHLIDPNYLWIGLGK